MDQFREIGGIVGSLKALMVLKHDIVINQSQCVLLFDIYCLAFEVIADEIKQNLRLDERSTKWKALELPLKELYRILKEGEHYIKHCLDIKDWWGKAISLHENKDCLELHIHNLLCCFPIVIEAIETTAEISGVDQDDMQKRRHVLMRKYDADWNDLKLFQWMFGKLYLVPREICNRLESAWREDRWFLLEALREKKNAASAILAKHEQKLVGMLLKRIEGMEPSETKLLPSWILLGANDYYVKRRLGSVGSHCKEINWMGESFALRNFFGEVEPLRSEISLALSVSHPNVVQYHCAFYDEERKEGFLVMELMSKNLATHIKENCGQRGRIPFSLPVTVDIMLQIARGMEYLHSKKIYHGDLNPLKILIKPRNSGSEGYYHAKVTGFTLNSIRTYTSRISPNHNEMDSVIWYAPEVLAEQERERPGNKCSSKHTEKADVYSFGMVCFELLTGKVPFEDGHLQGDKIVRNIRAGERPLFPFPSPKYLANLTRKCWQSNPLNRPSFASICRILRYIKKALVVNPDHGLQGTPPPLVDYCEIEAGYSKKFPVDTVDLTSVSQIPFQMFAYRIIEKEKSSGTFKDKSWDLMSETTLEYGPASVIGEEHAIIMDDLFSAASDRRSVCSEILERRHLPATDQRSVFSEIPHRKFASVDERSVCSESPRRKLFSTSAADQKAAKMEAAERKSYLGMASDPKSPDRRFSEPFANQKSVHSEYADKKPSAALDNTGSEAGEGKPSVASEPPAGPSNTTEKHVLLPPADQKPYVHNPERKTLLQITEDQMATSSEAAHKKTPVRKAATNKTIRPVIPHNKTVASATTAQRSLHSKIPEKRAPPKKKLNDIKDRKHLRTPIWNSSPSSFPARIPKVSSSLTSSPARAQKGYLSPTQSPLHACARFSRIGQESTAASAMSPSRPKRGHVSDSELP